MTLCDCEKLIIEIKKAQSIVEACHKLTTLLDYYQVVSIELHRGKTTYWRGRKKDRTPWTDLNKMGPPCPGKAKINRLNDAGSPLFYAATDEITVFHEISAENNDNVQIAGFKMLYEEPIKVAVVGELYHVHKLGYLRLIGADPGNSISKYINSLNPNDAERLLFIDAFLADILSDKSAEESDYMLSRVVASLVFRDRTIDGIIYPSVKANIGMNLALTVDTFNNKFHMVSCFYAKVINKYMYGFVNYEVLRDVERLDDRGIPIWMDSQGKYFRRYFNLSKEEYLEGGGKL